MVSGIRICTLAVAVKTQDLVSNFSELAGPQPRLGTSVFSFLMNKDSYAKLPPDLKKVIDDNSGLPLAKQIGRVWDAAEKPGRDAAVAEGATFYTIEGAELERWKAATTGVTQSWIDQMNAAGLDGQALVDDAKALIAKYAAE